MFRGINAITIDTKGRMAVPARYRDSLSSNLVLTIDTEERCLLLYLEDEWRNIEASLQKLPSFNPAARRIQRLLIGHATDLALDGQGRILLPQELRQYAAIQKQAVLIGQGNKFEIWDDALWHEKRELWLSDDTKLQEQLPDEMKTFSL
ncbi:MAG: transcriptional regulator MraZ [Gammaproteobacteria bacterium]|nr:transcriptional regulator MraZ [Gammaproteobacteria bacterium]